MGKLLNAVRRMFTWTWDGTAKLHDEESIEEFLMDCEEIAAGDEEFMNLAHAHAQRARERIAREAEQRR